VSDSKSVSKAVRAAERKQLRNRLVRSSTKTHISKVRRLINAGELETAKQGAVVAISSIDKAVSKGIIHRNKGARLKSRLVRKLNAAVAVGQSPESFAPGHSEEAKRPKNLTQGKLHEGEEQS